MKGIDLSENNPSVDFLQVKRDGFDFDFLKATEGATYNDSTFHSRFALSKLAGLKTGAYNFSRPATSTALDEVRHFVETVLAAGGFESWPEYPNHVAGALDLEDAGGLDSASLQAYAETWLTEFEQLTGKKGWLYTGESFFNEYGLSNVITKTGAELWLAAYGTTQPNLKEVIWQNSDTGIVQGVQGKVDTDVTTTIPVVPPTPIYYRVVGNDTMWGIAAKHGLTLAELVKLNPQIPNPNQICVGQTVRVR